MAQATKNPVLEAHGPAATALKVLVADDDPTTCRILQAILERDGWRVEVANDGPEAIASVERARPDLILLDVHMPTLDGIEAARRVRALAPDALLPIIFMTDAADEPTLVRCLEAGGDDFLPKPFGVATLRAKLKAITRTRDLHQVVTRQRDELVRLHAATWREHALAERVMQSIVHLGRAVDAGVQTLVEPASLFNGDLLLTARRPGGSLHVLLGDFTGHGLQAAIGAIPVAHIFRSMTEKGFTVGEIAGEMDEKLLRLLPTGNFLAACLAELDFADRRITVWSGGIPDALLFRPGKGIVARFPSSHLPLAVATDRPFDRTAKVASFQPDDRFILFSDGLIESRDESGEMFGEGRLDALLVPPLEGKAVFDEICIAVGKFRKEIPADDDVTLAVVRCAPTRSTEAHSDSEHGAEATPLPWSVALKLEARSLERSDPLPLLMQSVAELQGIESQRSTIFLVLQELYSNALDHGVLHLDSKLKSGPNGFGAYLQARAAALRKLKEGHVLIDLVHEPLARGGRLHVRVTDSGEGFDYSKWMHAAPPDPEARSGRGIALVRSVCESVRWNERGNEVEALLHWSVDGPADQDPPRDAHAR